MVNRRRNLRVFDEGEMVYRKKPAFARPPKQLMADPISGPYVVVGQSTTSSVILKDPETGVLVDGGANIPVEQILAGPRRPPFTFAADSEVRSIGARVRGDGGARSGARPGKRAGWGSLAPAAYVAYQTVPTGPEAKKLTIGKVVTNDREAQTVLVQPHRARWMSVKIVHEPLFTGPRGLTSEPTGKQALDTVRYEALVKSVSLLRDG